MTAAAPRSLAEDLRRRDDEDLAALLRARPDLMHPVPTDIAALAARAASGPAVAHALDALDRLSLQVVEVLAVLPEPTTATDVLAGFAPGAGHGGRGGADGLAGAVDERIGALLLRGLLWGDRDALHLVRPARDAVGPYPCGLGPPAAGSSASVRAYVADPARLDAELATAPPEARAVLDRLLWDSPVGTVDNAHRPVSRDSARTPIEWLLARDILVPVGPTTVALVREVGVLLRGGLLVRDPAFPPRAPRPAPPRERDLVDRTAGQHAFVAVRAVTDLLEAWSVDPPSLLRSGGLAVRDLTSAARLLDTDEESAATWVEVAYAAGLLASDDAADPAWLPTPAYDVWLSRGTAEQWAVLAQAWLGTNRAAGLVGSRQGVRVNALTEDVARSGSASVRRRALLVLADLPPGTGAPATEVTAVLDDREPRRASAVRGELVAWTLREAELLGVLGLGALATPGRTLLATSEPSGTAAARTSRDPVPVELAAAVASLLPEPLDHVLLQADLTAVAPGPLESSLARELGLVADVESTGGATVYRFSEASVRRGLDTGRSAGSLLAFLEASSRTPVPQPLRYLVEDVARRHGSIRVGAATSYVRCDDEATLTVVMADRGLAGLGLVRLAPTVLVAQAPVAEVLAGLRGAGLAPVAESSDGTVVLRRPDSRRTPPRPPRRQPRREAPTGSDALVTAAVRALRAGDRASTAPRGFGSAGETGGSDAPAMAGSSGTSPGPWGRSAVPTAGPARLGYLPRTSSATTLAALRDAVEHGTALWIGYADAAGTATERIIDPVRLAGGFLTAYDHRYEEVRTFAVARITGVAALDTDPPPG